MLLVLCSRIWEFFLLSFLLLFSQYRSKYMTFFFFPSFIAYVKSGKILSHSSFSVVWIYYLELPFFLCWKVNIFCCCPRLKGVIAEYSSAVVK